MSTKLDLGKIFFLILFLTLSVMTVMAGTIKGSITDKQTREPLTGATVQIVGTTQGAIADMDGNSREKIWILTLRILLKSISLMWRTGLEKAQSRIKDMYLI